MVVISDMSCPKHKVHHEVTVPEQEYRTWLAGGELIQNALPSVSIADREILMTGICQEAWDEMMGAEEE